MSNSFEEQMFKGKPVSQLNKIERGQYRRWLQKENKKSIKDRQKAIPQAVIDMKFRPE